MTLQVHTPPSGRRMARRTAALACGLALAAAVTQAVPARGAGGPVNKAPPAVFQVNRTLETSDGEWVGATRPFAYGWYRCSDATVASCQELAGQNAYRYTLTTADEGSRMRSLVTASNEVGSTSRFSAPTGPIAAVAPPPNRPGRPLRLEPFPVIVIAGRQRRRLTRITDFLVRGQARARVSVSCRGRGCPIRTVRGTIGSARRVRLRRAQRVYRAGSVIEIRVWAANRIGKFTSIRFRRGRAPARTDSCLEPGARRPSPCPR